jgi:hypothetical protein
MAADMDIDMTRRNKRARPLSESEKERLDEFIDAIHYSARCVFTLFAHCTPADRCQILGRVLRIPSCATPQANAQGHTERLL